MICPNPMCKTEISDDSVFCDRCGFQLKECSNCHTVLHTLFCSKCGKPTIEREWNKVIPIVKNKTVEKTSVDVSNDTEEETQTLIIRNASSLKLQHDDLILDIKSGDILGRTAGAHAGTLGDFKVISSHHAELRLNDNKWIVTDLGSTNGTFINNQKLESNFEYEINDDDLITLANVNFTARIN